MALFNYHISKKAVSVEIPPYATRQGGQGHNFRSEGHYYLSHLLIQQMFVESCPWEVI